ncbi:DUF6415 family natural product biosynthesis protein [Streptomyces macrosporus]|uniref:Uncharacterized protein n=1 Tax=Streptomyces macrosporus TaxID=44032 RepID=A0ABN3KDN2_9ACTN
MTQATDTTPAQGPSGDPIDADTISRTIRDALTEDPTRTHDDLIGLGVSLRGHMQLLFPIAEQAVDKLWHGSVQWYDARTRLDYIRRHMDEALGVTADSVRPMVARLARGCAWLLEQAEPRRRLCPRCREVKISTRMVDAVESGSGAGANIYACRDCQPHGQWDEEIAQKGA